MPKLKKSLPKLCLDKNSGQGVVRLGEKKHYLGLHGSPECQANYDALVSEWLRNGRRLPTVEQAQALSINQLILRFWTHAEGYYQKNGKPTSELSCYKVCLRPLRDLFGHTEVFEFGPIKLELVRERMIDLEWKRNSINKAINRIRHMFKWGVSKQLVPPSVLQALCSLEPLKKGRSLAKESIPRKPAADSDIERVLGILTKERTKDLIRLQVLSGARPGELLMLTTEMIQMNRDVWRAELDGHKTEHHEKSRILLFGPRSQLILKKYISVGNPEKLLFGGLTVSGYRRGVTRACERAGVPRFTPHLLRHTAGTRMREEFDVATTSTILGHATLDATQIYTSNAIRDAEVIVGRIG